MGALHFLRQQLGAKILSEEEFLEGPAPFQLDWPEFDSFLPFGGLPDGVTELSSSAMLGGITTVALRTIQQVHARDAKAWCAWFDPERTLNAPGLAQSGVDLNRLLVVRPPRVSLGRWALKAVSVGAFEWVVIDVHPFVSTQEYPRAKKGPLRARPARASRVEIDELWVRKLSLASEQSGTRVLLLTNLNLPRAQQWPVALRLECRLSPPNELGIRIGKDRLGRTGLNTQLSLLRINERSHP